MTRVQLAKLQTKQLGCKVNNFHLVVECSSHQLKGILRDAVKLQQARLLPQG